MFMVLFLLIVADSGKIHITVADSFYFRIDRFLIVGMPFFRFGALDADTVGIEPAHGSAVDK